MFRGLIILFLVALLVAACGGGGETAEDDSIFDGIGEAAESGTIGSGEGDSGPGSLEDPTPEGSGPLEPNTIRIGDTVWSPSHPSTTGQCFVQAADGTLTDNGTAWGDIDDEGSSFAFRVNSDESFTGEVRGNTMNWIAGQKDGSQLTIDLDVDASTISGEGLFYNGHTNEWAYGSFQFECEDDG